MTAGRRVGPGVAGRALPWLGGLLAVYLALPLVALAAHLVDLRSASRSGFAAPGLGGALAVSVLAATMATAVCAVLGVPLAYLLARHRGRLAALVGGAVLVPLALPPLMSGILLVSVLGPDTPVGRLFGGHLTDSLAGVVLAQVFVAAPFTVVAARSAFGAVEPALVDVAATLGLDAGRRLVQVWLPVAARGVAAGLALTWLRAFGEFGATVIVAYHPMSLPVYTYVRFGGFGLDQAMAPAVLAVAVALAMAVAGRLWRGSRRRLRTSPPGAAPGALRAAAPGRSVPGRSAAPTLAIDIRHQVGDLHLRVAYRAQGPHLAVLGASGAGKTTLLRCLAGLAGPAVGTVRLGSRDLGTVATEERGFGYVPQQAALLPHLDVRRQLLVGRHADPRLAAAWADRLGLHDLRDRFPDQLSGGERQRVALARALSAAPGLLLLDEPFSALDAPVRDHLRRELRAVQRTEGLATVLVTHDPEEAALLADEILVVDGGSLVQSGARAEVLARPATPAVARLLGIANIATGRVAGPGVIDAGGITLASPDVAAMAPGTPVLWYIRPEHLQVTFPGDPQGTAAAGSPDPRAPGQPLGTGAVPGARVPDARVPDADVTVLDATVLDAVDLGTGVEVRLQVPGLQLVARLARNASGGAVAAPGTPCVVRLPAEHVGAWAQDSP